MGAVAGGSNDPPPPPPVPKKRALYEPELELEMSEE
jgi:hypothetical protein